MISGDTWFVRVEGVVYGPYATAQMHDFISEGRVLESSELSTNPQSPFKEAREFTAFSDTPPAALPTPEYRTPDYTSEVLALQYETLRKDDVPYVNSKRFGQRAPTQAAKPLVAPTLQAESLTHTTPLTLSQEVVTIEPIQETVILIMAEMKTERTLGFLRALQLCGHAERVGSSVWLLRTALSTADLRNCLSPTLGDKDRLFLMDSFNGKTAWHNIGSDMDTRIRNLWNGSKT